MENLNTENFRAKVKKRLGMAAAYNAVFLILISVGKLLEKNSNVPDFALGFSTGVIIGIQAVMLFYMGKYMRALKDENKLKALCIEENDERAKYIASKVAGTGFLAIMGGVALGTVVASFLNFTVFLTLLGTLLFISLIVLPLKAYYNRKI